MEIGPEAQQAALRVLSSGWVTMGPETLAFERELASYLGAQHVVAVASGTAAIEIALRAMRLEPGAVVLTPSLTFCGAVAAIMQAGLRPVLVDADARTLLPTPATVACAVRHGSSHFVLISTDKADPITVRNFSLTLSENDRLTRSRRAAAREGTV